MRHAVVVLAVLAGCEEGPPCDAQGCPGDAPEDVSDGGAGDGGDLDDPDAAPPDPVRIAELSTVGVSEDDPSLTADELEIFFNVGTGIGGEVYTATRESRADAWSPPMPVAELNSSALDFTPFVSRDGLTLYLS